MDTTIIDYDIQARPLQIKTDSAAGSSDMIILSMYAPDSATRLIMIIFNDPITWYILHCSDIVPFTNLPDEQEKIWTIYMGSTGGPELKQVFRKLS